MEPATLANLTAALTEAKAALETPVTTPFDLVDAPPATGNMVTVRDDPRVKQAIQSLASAEAELGIGAVSLAMIEFVAGRFGIEL